MIHQDIVPFTKQLNAIVIIISTWMVAGTLDIGTALIYYSIKYNITRTLLLQNIASGVFGQAAFAGGTKMAILGLVFHYGIALFWTIVFFYTYPAITMFSKNRVSIGIAFGLVVWSVMNLVVLPLSNVDRSPFNFFHALIAAVILICCIGLPNSVIVGGYYAKHHQ